MFTRLKYSFALLLMVFLLFCYFSYPLLGPDSGFYLSYARGFYQGKIYFTEMAIAYNPLAIITLGFPMLFAENPDPRWSLLINMVFIVAAAFILHRILDHIRRDRQNVFYAWFFVLACLMLDGSHLVLEPVSVCYQLAGLLLYLNFKKSERKIYLVFAGLAFALSFLSKQYGLFILAPVGIDLLLSRKNMVKNTVLMALGFVVPIGLFYCYLSGHGVGPIDFIRHILGMGLQLDKGSGTGINYSLLTYLIGFGVFVAFNLYVLLLPGLLYKARRAFKIKNALYIIMLPFSLLVLVSATYAHYFLYVLPYGLIAFVSLSDGSQARKWYSKAAFSISLILMASAAVFSFSGRQQKVDAQQQLRVQLNTAIPATSKVYLDGLSPAFYHLCGFESVKLEKIGYTFPGYFYPKTIVGAMPKGAYLLVSEDAYSSYRPLTAGFKKQPILLDNQPFLILKKP